MGEPTYQSLQEAFPDDWFFLAAVLRAEECNLEEEGRAMAEELKSDPPEPVSEDLHRRIEARFAAQRAQEQARLRKTRGRVVRKKVFQLVALLAVILWALYISVGAVRTTVNNFVENISDGIFSLKILPAMDAGVTKQAYPGVIPEGFTCVENRMSAIEDYARYESSEDFYIYMRQTVSSYAESEAGISASEGRACEINGIIGQTSKDSAGNIKLVWGTEVNLYMLTSSLDRETIIELAESIPTK